MLKRVAVSLALAVFLMGAGLLSGQNSGKGGSGWKDLFKRDLSNAVMAPDSWVFEGKVLSAKDHGTIWTKESYDDFVLDLQFKVAKGANSGVFLRAGDIRSVLSALEIQVHESTDGSPLGMVGALYDSKAPSRNVAKPAGQWNRYTITCRGSRLELVFNGAKVLDVNLDDWNQAHRNPDGTRNKFAVALKDFSRSGPIGLQGLHGKEAAPVWYRNLRIKTLK